MTTLRAEISTRRVTDGRRRMLRASAVAVAAVFVLGVGSQGNSWSAERVVTVDRAAPTLFHEPGETLSAARLARSEVTWSGGPTAAATGEIVNVFVSAAVTPEFGTPQTWADFIAGLTHGPEISALTAYIATFAEMQVVCGEHALGCYGSNRLMSMGEETFGVTPSEVVRHEYGHHIAFHRLNPPWQSIDWGPKNWASASNVCRRADDGRAYPGDGNDHYSLNPGEAWAETYRVLDERKAGVTGTGWEIIDPSFYPNDAAFIAAERDILQPWTSPTRTVSGNRFRERGKRVWALPLTTRLDGVIEIDVKLPKNGLHEVVLLKSDRNTVVAEGLWSSASSKKITSTVCGDRSLVLRIAQKGAFGRVRVATRVP